MSLLWSIFILNVVPFTAGLLFFLLVEIGYCSTRVWSVLVWLTVLCFPFLLACAFCATSPKLKLEWRCRVYYFCLLAGLGLLLVFLLNRIAPPVSAWDGFSLWFTRAAELLSYFWTSAVCVPYPYEHRHPLTWSVILALYASPQALNPGSLYLPYISLFLAYISCVYTFFASCHRWWVAVISAVVVSTMPLVINHVYIVGYAEFPMGVFMFFATYFYIRYVLFRRWIDFSGAVFAVVIMASLKNIGILYLLIFVASAANARLLNHFRPAMLFAIVVCVLIAVVFMAFSMSEAAVNLPQLFAGRDLKFAPEFDWASLASVMGALVLNQSFSTVFLLLLAAVALVPSLYRSDISEDVSFMFSLAVGLVACHLILTFFSGYVAEFSRFGQDTLGSRLLLPVMMTISPMCLKYLLKRERLDTC